MLGLYYTNRTKCYTTLDVGYHNLIACIKNSNMCILSLVSVQLSVVGYTTLVARFC